MKYFNTSGPNIIEQNYTLERKNLIEKGLNLVERNRYFTIWAPRQTGKSTYFRLLADKLLKEGKKTVYFSVEGFNNYSIKELLEALNWCFKVQLKENTNFQTLNDLFSFFTFDNKNQRILIIDEIESLNKEYFNQFLHTIRQLYHSRTEHSLKSVILVGVSNILGIIQDNASPFNIADNLDIPFFTKDEVFELLEQHETETSQIFDKSVKQKIYEITAGQPGLVNGFAYQLVEKFNEQKIINESNFFAIEKWYLNHAIDKNVENIKNKAKVYRNFVEQILFNESAIEFEIDKENIKFLFVNGIIKSNSEGNVEFWVPLYKKKLYKAFYPYINGEKKDIIETLIIKRFLNSDGLINIDYLINKYKEYINKRSFRPYREKDKDGNFVSIPEAAMIYSFETYIDAIVTEVQGKTYREADVGLGKSDLIINLLGKEYLFETKKYYGFNQFENGKKQLAYYCQKLNINEGIYLVFLSKQNEYPEEVIEEINIIDNITIRCYLVYYDLKTDF